MYTTARFRAVLNPTAESEIYGTEKLGNSL
jgi:hypothetical protein